MIEDYVGKVINGDCVKVMASLPESCVDLIVTSPPYNVGIDYDNHNDRQSMEDYWQFTKDWLSESYRILKGIIIIMMVMICPLIVHITMPSIGVIQDSCWIHVGLI